MSASPEEQAQARLRGNMTETTMKASDPSDQEEDTNLLQDCAEGSDADDHKTPHDSSTFLAAALENLGIYIHKNERERALSTKNMIDAERRRAADLEIRLQKEISDKEHAEAICATLRSEQESVKEQLKQLTVIHASATQTLSSLQQELATSRAAVDNERNGRMEDSRGHIEEMERLKAAIQQVELKLVECQGALQAEKQNGQHLEEDKGALNTQLSAAMEVARDKQNKIEEIEALLSQCNAELKQLRPVAEYNEAIIHIWKDMPIKGKIRVVRELLNNNHPYYSQLEAAPGLIDACTRQGDVQRWLSGNTSQFQTALKDFPFHPEEATSAEEILAGEALREFQAYVNKLLEKAQIRIISPKPGEPINDEEHIIQGGADTQGGKRVVLQCLRNGYRYERALIRAIVQPAPPNFKPEEKAVVDPPPAVTTAPSFRAETGDASDAWYGLLVPRSRICSDDWKVQKAMKAFETLIAKAQQQGIESLDYGTLTLELGTIAPLFTSDYPHEYAQEWFDVWREVMTRAYLWIRNVLGIEVFTPHDDSPFDSTTMVWAPGATAGASDQEMAIEHATIVGFRDCTTGETVLKATVVPRRRGRI